MAQTSSYPPSNIQSCPGFFTGTIHTAQPNGHLEVLHDVPTYITRGSASSNSTIVFLTDGFGFNLVNNKLLADQYASKTGLRVLVPNLLPGGGVPLVMMRLCETMKTGVPWWNLFENAGRAWAALRLMSIVVPFGFKIRRLFPAVLGYVRAVRQSLPLGAKLGIAGFCMGGHWSTRICAEPAIEGGDSHLIDAHFTAHPSSVKPEEFADLAIRFRVPLSLALGEKDQMLPVDQAHKVESSLREVYRQNSNKLEVRIYDMCGHGFALRSDPKRTDENEGAERALEQAVTWFRRFLGGFTPVTVG